MIKMMVQKILVSGRPYYKITQLSDLPEISDLPLNYKYTKHSATSFSTQDIYYAIGSLFPQQVFEATVLPTFLTFKQTQSDEIVRRTATIWSGYTLY